jgi:FkbM family methyltransferase
MNVISCLRLLRLIPASMPGKSRLTRWLIDRLAQNGEAEIPALGLSFFVPALREPIASSLLANGTYEPQLCEALAKVLKKDGVFMDVGANVGLFSLLAAHRLIPEGRVAAFEASPRIFSFLERNAQRNPRPGLTLFHRAVTERSGDEMSFFDAPEAKFGMGSLANRFSSSAAVVKSISLDDAAEQLGLPRVDVIKVDVEGFELGVFRGARRLLSMTPAPVVFFEFNDWAEANATSAPGDAQRFLQELGYMTLPLEDWMRGDRRPRPPQTSGGGDLVAFKPAA